MKIESYKKKIISEACYKLNRLQNMRVKHYEKNKGLRNMRVLSGIKIRTTEYESHLRIKILQNMRV